MGSLPARSSAGARGRDATTDVPLLRVRDLAAHVVPFHNSSSGRDLAQNPLEQLDYSKASVMRTGHARWSMGECMTVEDSTKAFDFEA